MNSCFSRQGRFAKRLFFELDEIDGICFRALAATGLMPTEPSPVRIERFLEKQFGVDVEYEDFAEDVLGCTVFDSAGRVIRIAVATSLEEGGKSCERRLRSTLAHEGGHGLLHGPLFVRSEHPSLFPEAASSEEQDRILCRPGDIRPVGRKYDGRWWEYQANRAIGGLLLPKHLVRQVAEGYVFAGTIPPINLPQAIDELALVFNVHPVVVRIRLQEIFGEQPELTF